MTQPNDDRGSRKTTGLYKLQSKCNNERDHKDDEEYNKYEHKGRRDICSGGRLWNCLSPSNSPSGNSFNGWNKNMLQRSSSNKISQSERATNGNNHVSNGVASASTQLTNSPMLSNPSSKQKCSNDDYLTIPPILEPTLLITSGIRPIL